LSEVITAPERSWGSIKQDRLIVTKSEPDEKIEVLKL